MGQCMSTSAQEVSRAAKLGDVDYLLQQLKHQPGLLCEPVASSCFTGISDTLLHLACENNQLKVVQAVLAQLRSSPLDTARQALEPYCRRSRLPPPASTQQAAAIAIDLQNNKGQTPLMHACYANAPELVKFLLEQGADPWVVDRCGNRTALHYAAIVGADGCVRELLGVPPESVLSRRGSRYINCRSLCGLTPLHYAVFFSHTSTVQLLLSSDRSIAVNAATTAESYDVALLAAPMSTPLHFAALKGSTDTALQILRFYAQHRTSGTILDPRRRYNASNQLPFHVAVAYHPDHRALANMLHPSVPLARVVGDDASGDYVLGPPTLARLAAAALMGRLMARVELLEREVVEEAREAGAGPAATRSGAGPGVGSSLLRALSIGRCAAAPSPPPSHRLTSGLPRPASSRLAPRPSSGSGLHATWSRSPHGPGVGAGTGAGTGPIPGVEALPVVPQSTLRRFGSGHYPPADLPPVPALIQEPVLEEPSGHVDGLGLGALGGVGAVQGEGGTDHREGQGTNGNGNGAVRLWSPFAAAAAGPAAARPPGQDGQPAGTSSGGSGSELQGGSPTGSVFGGAKAGAAVVAAAAAAVAMSRNGSAAAAPPPARQSPRRQHQQQQGGRVSWTGGGGGGGGDGGVRMSRLGSMQRAVSGPAPRNASGPPLSGNGGGGKAGGAAAGAGVGVRGCSDGDDDDDDEGLCGVCYSNAESVAPAGCGHGLCGPCAQELCRGMAAGKPLLCPFCRQVVGDFVRVVHPAVRRRLLSGGQAVGRVSEEGGRGAEV